MTADEPVFDFVVAGSGAAGMTAALTAARSGLSVLVIEKTEYFGGSTARSGGGVWVPRNSVLRKAGIADTAEQADAYLAHVGAESVPPGLRRAYLEHGPQMLDFVLANTPLGFDWVPGYSDYYPEAPGGRPGGRSIEPSLLDGRVLGPELASLRPPYLPAPAHITVTQANYRWMSLGTSHPRAITTTARVTGRMIISRLRHRQLLSMGQALAAGLREGLIKAQVPVWLSTPMTGLLIEDGRVTGLTATKADGGQVTIRARRGVLLATGGFERNDEMRKRYQRNPVATEWTVGSPGNTGDGILAGQEAGGVLDLMDEAWWGPSIPLASGPVFCLAERSLPGSIFVNAAGERFVNEAAPYVDAVHVMYDKHTEDNPHIPCWMIADQRYRNRYVFTGIPPRKPLPRRWLRSGVVVKADSLAELASQIGVSADGLTKTVQTFNEFAKAGKDADFGRGDSAYDHYYGDPNCKPNPNLAPLATPPYYAIKIVPGDLGTKGGLRTDEHARVLRADGSVIDGLYAAGNTSAMVMGRSYAGPGATIGPAMTFGYLAALDAAAANTAVPGTTGIGTTGIGTTGIDTTGSTPSGPEINS
ncbi:MAG TPA: 3-oxosteroid 1-dehydrogenase [Streptosporangiaceae bacterium]|nr:3-oxosteroid 1-dehydrogenase [Streptosporangiaceae bacterium]